uniref:ATP-binding cassette sub-family D n=1 Tax=Nephromyces sp. MMRI TaxID=2496275 RepID=A0A3Q8UC37_9APIC|nr:ATP-binding cassette sub-family D [Nephromyces sp. MMRI]
MRKRKGIDVSSSLLEESSFKADSSRYSSKQNQNEIASTYHDPDISLLPRRSTIHPATIANSLKIFGKLAKPFFMHSPKAKQRLAMVLLLSICSAGLSVTFSYFGRDFWNALASRNVQAFWYQLQRFMGLLVLAAPIIVYSRYTRDKLGIEWRNWFTKMILKRYSEHRIYYQLALTKEIDNPDQRIAEDVKAFTSTSLRFFLTIFSTCIDLSAFSFVLISIDRRLFIAALLYSIFGTFITFYIGRTLVFVNSEQQRKEADFRYSLVRMREHSESIALYGGEILETNEIISRLSKLVYNSIVRIQTERNLEYFTTSYRYIIQVLPAAVVAPRFFASQIPLGVVSQSYGAFNHILSDLSFIINQFESISAFAAGIDRLYQFSNQIDYYTKLDQYKSQIPPPIDAVTSRVITSFHSENLLQVINLSVMTPDRTRTLFENLNFQVTPTNRLLIVGNSGIGKSSLLRVIAGLWDSGHGSIHRPVKNETLFLPQKPYCILGTLRQQLLYPKYSAHLDVSKNEFNELQDVEFRSENISDAELTEILRRVELGDLLDRLNEAENGRALDSIRVWSDMLSLGEQQRLAFGRLLVNSPKLALLDECSSALDIQSEKHMYQLLSTMENLAYISVGHRPSLSDYHDSKLSLDDIQYKNQYD